MTWESLDRRALDGYATRRTRRAASLRPYRCSGSPPPDDTRRGAAHAASVPGAVNRSQAVSGNSEMPYHSAGPYSCGAGQWFEVGWMLLLAQQRRNPALRSDR